MNIYDDDTLVYKETAYALFLDKANKTIGWLKISKGGTWATIVDPKIFFVTVLNCNASGIILSHNHPSGRMKASEEDLRITDKIISIGKLLGVIVLESFNSCQIWIFNYVWLGIDVKECSYLITGSY